MKAASAGKGKRALEIMRENMCWALEEAIPMLDRCKQAEREGAIPSAIDWINEEKKLREFAQKCAEAIAPYEDSKLVGVAPVPPQQPEKDLRQLPIAADRLAHITDRFRKGLHIWNGGTDPRKS